jgi:riboflavin-specific deaminase-like protein
VLCDDPRLTVREVVGPQPRRLVLDSTLRLPDSARLFDGGGELWVFAAHGRASARDQQRLHARGAEVTCLTATPDGRVSLQALMATLAGQGVKRLLVEGGAAILTSFLRERLADAVQIDIAPCFLGAPAIPGLADLGVVDAGGAIALDRLRIDRLGPNLLLSGAITYDTQPSDHRSPAELDHVRIPLHRAP